MEYLLAFILTLVGIYKCQRKNKAFIWYMFSLQPIIMLAALRSVNIGVDTGLYVFHTFYVAERSRYLIDYLAKGYFANGYLFVNWCVSRFTDDVHIYLYIIHSIMYGTILYALYRLRDRLQVWMGVFILCFIFYRESLNIARQFAALGFDILAFSYLIERKWVKVSICTFLGYEFHHSALIFIIVIVLFYMLSRFPRIFDLTIMKIAITAGVVISLLTFSLLLESLNDYGLVDEEYMRYLDDDESNLPISQLTLYLINLTVFYRLNKSIMRPIVCFFEYIILISLLLCFSSLISTYTIRIMAYFSYMSIVIFPMMYYKYKSNIKDFHMLFFILYWFLTVVVANLSGTYPYEFYFD